MIGATRLFLKEVKGSAAIAEAGYDQSSHTLAIRFHTQDLYIYLNVPSLIAHQFLHDETSKGQYLNDVIRPHYFSVEISKYEPITE